MSSSDTTSWHTASTMSKGRYRLLIQTVCRSDATSLNTGSFAISSFAYGFTVTFSFAVHKDSTFGRLSAAG